jgi:hypothetical protein
MDKTSEPFSFSYLSCQSYMEGHLKNKDKLEQEWLALCAYEADPCSTTVAEKVRVFVSILFLT